MVSSRYDDRDARLAPSTFALRAPADKSRDEDSFHARFNLSDTEPVVAVVARSDASEWEHIVDFPSRRRPGGTSAGA